jgi:hypothetical protein
MIIENKNDNVRCKRRKEIKMMTFTKNDTFFDIYL